MLEQNIQQALQQGNIDLEDAIDLREVKNVKLANELLKIRRRQREEKEMAKQQQNIQAQAQANAQTQQVAAQAEVQKQQALIQIQSQLAQLKSQLSMQETKADAELKKELMALEFQYSMQLRGSESQTQARRDAVSEDRKDIRQIRADRNNQKTAETKNATTQTPKKFESSGNDILGGINLGGFEPR